MPLVTIISEILEDDSINLAITEVEVNTPELGPRMAPPKSKQNADLSESKGVTESKLHYVRMISEILGESLAKNLIDRTVLLSCIFKLIEVEQQDEVLKEIGRGAIDFSLTCAENDQSVDFFKYMPCFVIPVLKNSSTNTKFSVLMAKLFKLLPLNKAGVFDKDLTDNSDFNPSEEYEKGFEFLQILSNKKCDKKDEIIKHLNVQEKIREYQQHGIAWIVSLTDFGFNWALCDDMGLGKTLQALSAVAIKVKERKALLGKKKGKTISLVVWPSTLVHNWNNEIQKFFNESDLKGSVIYDGSLKFFNVKEINNEIIPNNDIVIISYDKLRANLDNFLKLKFLYIILDEAHLIKNAKSLTTLAIKSLKAERKLILTGTPLQNRVTELWSIFDFLMPGFLEDEATFNKKYKKYLSANLKKIGEKEKETEQFLMSIQSLRERISPFILRRTKENVMKELPPKIIQDYQWPLSPTQLYLHDILEKMFPYVDGIKSIDTSAKEMNVNKSAIENLLAHRQLCNHPNFIIENKKIMKLVHEEIDPDVFSETIKKHTENQEIYEQSGKLRSLISLLEEWGLLNLTDTGKVENGVTRKGEDNGEINDNFLVDDTNDHRALIFCQMKGYMQMIRKEILTKFGIKHLVLDSSLNPKQRFEAAEKFNKNKKYKIMLVSTKIGSLGLNLTGADTVIFMEHDWNPMCDLQAIDRAHRIGQTKTVTVYRLISMGTLEEKIMNLQRFKKKLHKMLITEKDTTGATGEDKGSDIQVSNILKSFENQDAFKNEIGKGFISKNNDEDDDRENFLSKVDKEWLNLD